VALAQLGEKAAACCRRDRFLSAVRAPAPRWPSPFTTGGIEDMVRHYVGRVTDLPPDALPGAAKLTNLPATAIVVSEYDDLRPSGDLLAVQLEESGVPVQTYLAAGMLHGHLNRAPSLKEVDRTLDLLASVL
jgi:acetyl esterase